MEHNDTVAILASQLGRLEVVKAVLQWAVDNHSQIPQPVVDKLTNLLDTFRATTPQRSSL